jgi:hypothetical protein
MLELILLKLPSKIEAMATTPPNKALNKYENRIVAEREKSDLPKRSIKESKPYPGRKLASPSANSVLIHWTRDKFDQSRKIKVWVPVSKSQTDAMDIAYKIMYKSTE